jgi:hypothetical protein
MANLTETLKKISDYLWKPVYLTLNGNLDNAFFFDMRKTDEETIEYLQDTLDGEQPDELNLEYVIPIAVTGMGVGYGIDGSDYKEGKFRSENGHFFGQFSTILFANMKESVNEKTPIYSIEVDGNIIPGTYRKVVDDLSELDLKLGRAVYPE